MLETAAQLATVAVIVFLIVYYRRRALAGDNQFAWVATLWRAGWPFWGAVLGALLGLALLIRGLAFLSLANEL